MPNKLTGFLNMLKKADEAGALKDYEDVFDADKWATPPPAMIGQGSHTVEMRGDAAVTETARNSDVATQMGLVRQYEEIGGRMSRMEKALAAQSKFLADFFKSIQAPAEPASAVKALLDDANAKLRKAKSRIRKAEDEEEMEEDDEFKENLEKAQGYLDAAYDLISKAEDEAEDEEEDDAAEKARKQWRTLKAAVAATREARVAAKAAKAAALKKAEEDEKEKAEKDEAEKARLAAEATAKAEAAQAAAAAAASGVQPAPAVDPNLQTAFKSITEALGVQNKSLLDLMTAVSGTSRGVVTAPVIVKSEQPSATATLNDIEHRIEDAANTGLLDLPYVVKARSIVTRLRAVEAGAIDKSVVDAELARQPEHLRKIFEQPVAA